jgi:polyferredoxin
LTSVKARCLIGRQYHAWEVVVARSRWPVIRERRMLQVAFTLLAVAIGVQFYSWAAAHLAGEQPRLPRPAGVEGFLPISALMSLRLWLAGQGVHPVHPAALAILLGTLAMSLAAAKSFCSHLCPVGAISEWLGRLGQRLLGRTWQPPRWLDVPLRSVKYVLLAFFVWATWIAMDVPAVKAFLDSPYNRVADVKIGLFFANASRVTIAVLGVLVVGSVLVRDLWCRYLCPYGALLGLFGRLSPLKVTRDESTCTDCRKCTKVCPARLQVHALVRVASVECTSCQDCVAACPIKDCLAVRLAPAPRPWPRLRPTHVVALAVAIYVGVTLAFRATGHWRSSVSEAEYAARLPHLDSPLYTHIGGLAAAETAEAQPRPVPSHPMN